jgi:transcriptional regulator with XRE-family HTH domain
MRQPTIARARPRAASTEVRTARAVGGLPLPSTSQSIDTPNARANADAVSVVARCRPVSSSATWDGDSPASALASRAEMPASCRTSLSRSASDMVSKPLAATSTLVKRAAVDLVAEARQGHEVSEIAERIESVRAELGISRRELSRRAGLSPSHVEQLTAGRVVTPSAVVVAAIAHALGVSVDWLATGQGPRRRESRPVPATLAQVAADAAYTADELDLVLHARA